MNKDLWANPEQISKELHPLYTDIISGKLDSKPLHIFCVLKIEGLEMVKNEDKCLACFYDCKYGQLR